MKSMMQPRTFLPERPQIETRSPGELILHHSYGQPLAFPSELTMYVICIDEERLARSWSLPTRGWAMDTSWARVTQLCNLR